MTPCNYTLSLHAMTCEKLEFLLPAVFTIGPKDDPDSLKLYAKLLSNSTGTGDNTVEELVRGIVEGETRVITAGMTIEEIFKERKLFKDHVMRGVQSELSQFGMLIYNANVKELQDAPGSEYFKYLRLKSHEGAINQAKVDVAQAKFKGAVGEKEREGEQRKETSKIEANAVVFEQSREIEMSDARSKLLVQKAGFENLIDIAKIEAQKKVQMRDAELQKDVELLRAAVLRKISLINNRGKAESRENVHRYCGCRNYLMLIFTELKLKLMRIYIKNKKMLKPCDFLMIHRPPESSKFSNTCFNNR